MKKISFVLGLLLVFSSFALAENKIDINTATLEQLDELAGIGPKYAQAIIDGRPYSSVDDLERVKGIGPKTLEKIKAQGLACVNCPPSQAGITQIEEKSAPPAGGALESPATIYPSGVFINEVLPSPKGPDETDEFIELYNSNNFEVDLAGWNLQDKAGAVTDFRIDGKKIMPGGFLVFWRPETKIMLNNEGDGLALLSPDKKIVDSVDFTKAPTGQSYNKINSEWAWSPALTPGISNVAARPITASPQNTQAGLSKEEKSAKNNDIEAQDFLAGLNPAGNKFFNRTNPWFLFFTVLIITVILSFAVLFIKFKLNKTNVRT